MDPLSVTSGVVGIVAFVFQLARTVSKVRTAVEEMKSAPKEARDLIERLIMLETACQLISVHLDRRKALSDHVLPPSLDLTSKALAQFLAKAQGLEQMLSDLTSSNGRTWKLRPKSDTALLSRLRLVLRKDKINALVQEIDRVISLLQFVIQVDMWTFTSTPQHLPSLSSNGTELTNESLKLERTSTTMVNGSVPSQCTVPSKARVARNQHRRTFRYLGYVTWTIADGWIGEDGEDDADRITYRRGNIIFRLPCTSTRINIQYNVGMGTPSYALNVTHIIEKHSELGIRVWGHMKLGGDTQKLHEMVSKRELSIYSSIRFLDRETNLFFMAVSMKWADGCRYLLEHDFRHEFEEANTPLPLYKNGGLSGACEVTEILLSVRGQDMLETDMEYLLSAVWEPEYFTRYLKVFMQSPGIDCADLLACAWESITQKIFAYETTSSWVPALQCCIEHGIDIHLQCSRCGSVSAYIQILRQANHPFTADDRVYKWLDMLKACGVDLGSYVEAETALIQEVGLRLTSEYRRRNIILLDYDGLQIPSWRWDLPTEGSAIEVFGEFMNLGSEFDESPLRVVYPAGPDDFGVWKRTDIPHALWLESCFPFCLYPIDCISGADDSTLDGRWCRATYNRACEIRASRFARRQAKKWRKAHPGEESPLNKLPGTWVD